MKFRLGWFAKFTTTCVPKRDQQLRLVPPRPISPLANCWLPLNWRRSPHLASIPHLLSADQQPTSFAICLSASEPVSRHLIGNRGRHHSASSTLVKPLSSVSLFSIGCLWQSAELKGSHMPAGGYFQVRRVTCGYMWVCVGGCWLPEVRDQLPAGVCRQLAIVQLLPSPVHHRSDIETMFWRLIVDPWRCTCPVSTRLT